MKKIVQSDFSSFQFLTKDLNDFQFIVWKTPPVSKKSDKCRRLSINSKKKSLLNVYNFKRLTLFTCLTFEKIDFDS
jgi:hypothetical protein